MIKLKRSQDACANYNKMLQHAPPQMVIGTAGHVDHGKSSLVRALTGTDPDRLPQEKSRGLTIELGFAFLPGKESGYDCDLGFVDCPGHSKFLRHAIAGMGAMNGCLLVIAADEGIAAQTREHLALLRLLDLAWGRIIISKAGLVPRERQIAIAEEAYALCSGTPLAVEKPLITDAHDGTGLDILRSWLFEQAQQRLATIVTTATPRLSVDRIFSVKGHGTVVTGTLLGGHLKRGMQIACFPGPTARIRSLQVRSLDVEEALAGQRTAINLAGVDKKEIQRGSWISLPNALSPTTRIDIMLQCIEPGVKHGDPVRIFHGAASVSARVILLEEQQKKSGQARAQLRLDEALFLSRGDQVVLRKPSPSITLGAATVLAVDAPKHKRMRDETRRWFDDLQGNAATRLLSWLEQRDNEPATQEQAERFCGGVEKLIAARDAAGVGLVLRQLSNETFYWSAAAWNRLQVNAADYLQQHAAKNLAEPWYPMDSLHVHCAAACPKQAWEDRLAAWQAAGGLLRRERLLCAPEYLPELPAILAEECKALHAGYKEKAFNAGYDNNECATRPHQENAKQALAILSSRGYLIRLSDRQHMHRETVAAALLQFAQSFAAGEEVDFQWAKRQFGVSRRYILPLLEWCDSVSLTQRHGNVRVAGGKLGDGKSVPIPLLGGLEI